MLKNKPITYGSLYAGVGGIDKGFDKAGFIGRWANEWDSQVAITFIKNHPHPLIIDDVSNMFPDRLNHIKDVDVLTAGYPCQSFSIAGKRLGFNDPRGNHFFTTLKIANDVNARVIFLENVKNFKHHDKGNTYKIATETLVQAGYAFKDAILNTMTHGGLPQNRERFFLVASRDRNLISRFEFPEEIPLITSFRDYLEDNVPEKYYYDRYSMYDQLVASITNPHTVYQWRRKYVRENKKGVCPTLTKNMGTGGHNVPLILDQGRIRKLTPRECFNLQGFDNIRLPNLTDSHLYKQAGNSVSIPVIERIAKNIMEVIC